MPPKKKTKKSLGRRFVEWKPLTSRYPDDEKKARLQEDRVADMIDFFVPQTKKDVALEAAFALVPGVSGKMVSKGANVIRKKVPEVVEYLKNYISSPQYLKSLDKFTESWDEAVELRGSYLNRLDEIDYDQNSKIGNNTILSPEDINKHRPEYLKDVGGEVEAVYVPSDDKIFLNRNTVKDIDEKSAVPLLAEEIMHLVTKGNKNIPPKMKAAIKQSQIATPKLGRYVRSYKDGDVPRITKKSIEYAHDETETYSKIMATRATGGLKPGQVIGEVDLPKASLYRVEDWDQGITTMANEGLQDLRHGYRDREIADLMTKLPLVMPNIEHSDLEGIEIINP